MVFGQVNILVHVERHDMLESTCGQLERRQRQLHDARKLSGLDKLDEVFVRGYGRRARRQSEHERSVRGRRKVLDSASTVSAKSDGVGSREHTFLQCSRQCTLLRCRGRRG